MKTELNKIEFSLDLAYYYEDGDDFESFEEKIMEAIGYEEIIFYSKAMQYLSENDPSLCFSLNIAIDLGFSMNSLNSEILATLLYQDNLKDEFYKISEYIKAIL